MKRLFLGLVGMVALAVPAMGAAKIDTVQPTTHVAQLWSAVWKRDIAHSPKITRVNSYTDSNGVIWGNVCYLPPSVYVAPRCPMVNFAPFGSSCTCFFNGVAYSGEVGT